MHLGRWARLLSDRDDGRVWKAINWKEEFAGDDNYRTCPSSDEFKDHFEPILKPDINSNDDRDNYRCNDSYVGQPNLCLEGKDNAPRQGVWAGRVAARCAFPAASPVGVSYCNSFQQCSCVWHLPVLMD